MLHVQSSCPTPSTGRKHRWKAPLFLLLASLVLFSGLLACAPAEQPVEAPPVQKEASPGGINITPEDMLRLQKDRNAILEEEIQRLRSALEGDPCLIPENFNQLPLEGNCVDCPPVEGASRAEGKNTPADSGKTTPNDADKAKLPEANTPPEAKDGTDVSPVLPPLAPPSTVGELLEQATVFILVEQDNGVALGTGFFVAPGIVLTNQHVVGEKKDAAIVVTSKVLGKVTDASLLARTSASSNRDYALLSVSGDRAKEIPSLTINAGAKRSDRVSAWGFPAAVSRHDPKFQALLKGQGNSVPEIIYSEGVISVIMDQSPPLIMHTALISQGNSGGPLVNEKGEVIGINTMISLDDESYRQMGISLASSDILNFLKENGVTPTVASGDKKGTQ